MKLICQWCSKPYQRPPSSRGKYCSFECYAKAKHREAWVRNTFICPVCNRVFHSQKRIRVYCSARCRDLGAKNNKPSPEQLQKVRKRCLKIGYWNDGPTYVSKNGRVIVTGTSKGIQTVIAERILGRRLKQNEVVHHMDENPLNNEHRNLVICERSIHPLLHARTRALKALGEKL